MYIKSVRLENIKCFEDVTLEFQHSQDDDPETRQNNWNVILGYNGDGKTSLLQGIAACLMDATTAERLLNPAGWVRQGSATGRLSAQIVQEAGDRQIGAPNKERKAERNVQYLIVDGGQELESPWWEETRRFFPTATVLEPTIEFGDLFDGAFHSLAGDMDFLKRNAFSERENGGWLSCGYGAFRRIAGFASHTVGVTEPLHRRFLTLFEEGAALHDCEAWLKELDRQARRSKKRKHLLEEVTGILRELLDEVDEVRIEDEVRFFWRGTEVQLGQLSDGYRSMFALAVDLLRWVEAGRPEDVPLREARGVVLVDEVDAHLHPRWQRQVGFLLTRVFPNIQFIVTSHSPFVAMAAGNQSLTLLEKTGAAVQVNQDVPFIRGWAVDQILTELFGLASLRDPRTEGELDEYEKLRIARRGGQLDEPGRLRLAELEQRLNQRLQADPESPREKQFREDMAFFAAELQQSRSGSR